MQIPSLLMNSPVLEHQKELQKKLCNKSYKTAALNVEIQNQIRYFFINLTAGKFYTCLSHFVVIIILNLELKRNWFFSFTVP